MALIGTLYREIRGGSYPVRAAIHPLLLKIRLINHNYNSGTVRGKSFNIIFVQISEDSTKTLHCQGDPLGRAFAGLVAGDRGSIVRRDRPKA